MENVWIANIISSVTVLGVLGWLLSRLVNGFEKRITENEHEVQEVRKNYIQRFEEVHEKIDDSERNIRHHFTEEIKKVVEDKNNYRITQARELGEISVKLDNLTRTIENNRNR